MFDIGFWELLILAGLGLMILGPDRLPRVVGQLGRWLRKARRTASQLRWQIEHELDLTERREAEQKRRKAAPPAPPKNADNADGSGASHADAASGDAASGDANTPVSDPVTNASPPAGTVPGGVTTDVPVRMPDAGATAAPEPDVSGEERERRAPSQH